MLTDITLGQYFPGNSYLHRLDPRMKIMGTMIFIFSVFLANEPFSYAVLAGFIAFTYALSRLSVQTMVKSLKPLWGIIIFTFAVHVFIEHLWSPFKRFGVPAHELAMMMTIAMRFIPTLLEETGRIMKAQTARGANFTSGNLWQRGKNMVPLLVPLFISAFRRADDLATAMEARCYRGGEGRTRLHELAYSRRDGVAFFGIVVLTLILAVLRWV